MKKGITASLALFAFCLFAAFAAKAEYIWFIVDSYNPEGDTSLNFTYARLGVALDGEVDWNGGEKTYLSIVADGLVSDSIWPTESSGPYVRTGEGFAQLQADYMEKDSGYTFYVETYDDENNILWTYDEATAKSFEEISDHIVPDDVAAGMMEPNATVWNVPEPSSGLLVLLGLAGLALKRRRTGLPSRVSHEVRT